MPRVAGISHGKCGSSGLLSKVSSRPKSVMIGKQCLKVTEVLDTFYQFCALRHILDTNRRAGLPKDKWLPYSDNVSQILHNHRFCNTFRVADKVTQYIIKRVIPEGSQDLTEVVFRVILFNMFTKIETWELLQEKLGSLTWSSFRANKFLYLDVLHGAYNEDRILYTGAFQKSGANTGGAKLFERHLDMIECMMLNDFVRRVRECQTLEDIYKYIISFPGFAEFAGFQLVLNLSYTDLFHFNENDFVVPGPGARSGLIRCFRGVTDAQLRSHTSIAFDLMSWLRENQDEHFHRLGFETPMVNGHHRMQLPDIEHALCEVDKLSRILHPSVPGVGRKSNKLPPYRVREDYIAGAPDPIVLPATWDHPDRLIERGGIHTGIEFPKQYVVNSVIDERMRGTSVEYLVTWWGYSDRTWEPRENLLEDAPYAVKEWETSAKADLKRPPIQARKKELFV